MNNILSLRGNSFTQKSRNGRRGPITIPKGSIVSIEDLQELNDTLKSVKAYWDNNGTIIKKGILVSAYYNCIVAKSNRINGYLNGGNGRAPNETVVGAKFNNEKTKHIITHFIPKYVLEKTISISGQIINLFREIFPEGEISSKEFSDSSRFDNVNFDEYDFSKTTFKQYLRDSCYLEKFDVELAARKDLGNSIVTFYDTNSDILPLLKKINVNILENDVMNQTTVFLDEKNLELVLNRIPYLVSMIVEDFSKLSPTNSENVTNDIERKIPHPTIEPVIGVIDTLFKNDVYFSEWVEYYDLISSDINKEEQDYDHGTAVSSLIVDAPNLNSRLDDGCGRFQVRHFGVSLQSGFNSFTVIKQIEEIISQNLDVKVWNLSLGSNDEIRNNFISAEAALLDEIQFKYDVIFIVAGTNDLSNKHKKIGAPADSLNSIIVNSVDFNDNPASYSRQGIVLSFFIKPDISYYGGGNGDFINVYGPSGLRKVAGTSFAAPLIARKVAYLIYIMGLSREEAKAVLIDSAIPWNDKKSFKELSLIGNGIVPIKISDILMTPDDEIKFIVSDVSKSYDTYNYDFPVPISNENYPYVAKATMCYFPKCSRNQGVDYTNTEMQITFGPLNEKGIKSINKDKQHMDDEPGYIKEASARNMFRKWDNVKHICESFTPRKRPKPILNMTNPQWGMSIKTIERFKRDGQGVPFGVVITLKELNGINRIEDFIKNAMLRGWIVNELEIDLQVDLYNNLNEEIDFE